MEEIKAVENQPQDIKTRRPRGPDKKPRKSPPSNKIHEFNVRWKDDKKEYFKCYYQQIGNEIINCPCGVSHTKQSINRHLKSNRHKRLINVINPERG